MGLCLGTSSGFKLNEKRGQDKMAARLFGMIGLEKYDVSCFYTAFSDIDIKGTGRINTEDLFVKYRLPKSEFLRRLFCAGVNERKDKLNFTDFIAITWNFLSLDESLLPTLAYYLFDSNNDDSLDFAEVKYIVECIHQKSYNSSAAIRSMIDFMQYTHAQISRAQFSKFCKNNHNIYSPILSIQFNMRKKIIGDLFWNKISTKRITLKAMCKPEYVYECLKDCEVLRDRLAIQAKLAEFQETKKTMLSEQKSQIEKDKEAKQTKFQKMEEEKSGDIEDIAAETETKTKTEIKTESQAEAEEGEKPTGKVFSSKLKRSISTKMMAVKGFKEGVKVAPGTPDESGGEEKPKLKRNNSSRKLSISDNDDDNKEGRRKIHRRDSKKLLLDNSDDDEGGGGRRKGHLKRSNSRKMSISNSDSNDDIHGKLKRRSSSRKISAGSDDDGGGGGANIKRSNSKKMSIMNNSSDNNNNKDDIRGQLKRSSSRKLAGTGTGDDSGGSGGGGGGGGNIKRSNSRKSIAIPAGEDGRRKLGPISAGVKLEPIKKQKSKKSSKKHNK